MVLIVSMMVMLCLADGISDAVIGLVQYSTAPRPRVVRARRYRFN